MTRLLLAPLTFVVLTISSSLADTIKCPKPGEFEVGLFCFENNKAIIKGYEWVVTDDTKKNLPYSFQFKSEEKKLKEPSASNKAKAGPNECPYEYQSFTTRRKFLIKLTPAGKHTVKKDKNAEIIPVIEQPNSCPRTDENRKSSTQFKGSPKDIATQTIALFTKKSTESDGKALESAKQDAEVFAKSCFAGASADTLLTNGGLTNKLPGKDKTNIDRCVAEQAKQHSIILSNIKTYLREATGIKPDQDVIEAAAIMLLTHHMTTHIMQQVASLKETRAFDYKKLEIALTSNASVSYSKATDALTQHLELRQKKK